MKQPVSVYRMAAGPLVVCLTLVVFELIAWFWWRFPNPGVVLLPLAIASTLLGGLGSGLVAAVLSDVYFVYVNQVPDEGWYIRMAPKGWTSIFATTIVVPLTEIVRRQFVRMSDERFGMLANNIAEIAWMADGTGKMFWQNRRWYDYTGTSPEDPGGVDFRNFIHPDHTERVFAKWKECLENGIAWEDTFPIRARDGGYHWFLTRAVPVRDKYGNAIRWFGTSANITRQLEVERELVRLKDRLEVQVAERTAVAESRAVELRRLANELTEVEQRERTRLAQVLHDDLQQLLVAAKMRLATAFGPGNLSEQSSAVERLLSQAIETSRSLSKELAPPVLLEEGLEAGVNWLSNWARERYALQVETLTSGSGKVGEPWLRVFLFEAARELLLNIAKHAATDRVRVSLAVDSSAVTLTVEDFGKGFSPERLIRGKGSGSGLFNLQRRVELMGGRVKITSSPGKGTRIQVTMRQTPSGNPLPSPSQS